MRFYLRGSNRLFQVKLRRLVAGNSMGPVPIVAMVPTDSTGRG